MAKFHVICLDTQEALKDETTGEPVVFLSGPEASGFASEMTAKLGKRHQPRPVKDDGWMDREAKRLSDGTYTRLPWDNVGRVHGVYERDPRSLANPDEYYRDIFVERPMTEADCRKYHHWFYVQRKPEAEHHYAHVSMKHPGKIAFTETPEKGAQDIQATMNPGRYLKQFYDLDEDTIRTMANEFLAKYGDVQLKFGHTADEFEHIYTNGPNSCMSHAASEYASDEHPVRVYAAGDLAVAYLVSGDEEHITARAICWPEEKTYGRIYGDADKLDRLLEAAGFTQDENCAKGARMLKVEQDGAYVVPYVDYIYRAHVKGKFLIIDPHGDISCEGTNGLSATRHVCDHCYETFYCEVTGETIAIDDGVRMDTGDMWSQRRFDREGVETEDGENMPIDDTVILEDGTIWSQARFDRDGRSCSHCGECMRSDERCESCEQDEDEDTGETVVTPKPHVARQGRDNLPGQLEMPLVAGASVATAQSPYDAELRGITVGSVVVCNRDCPGQFTSGARYLVRSVHKEMGVWRLDFAVDDRGSRTNGWCAAYFDPVVRDIQFLQAAE